MKACRITIKNFRGVRYSTILLPDHAVLIGDNNTGKTTVLEALDLVLGPDRISRQPAIDEHDFFQGVYMAKADEPASSAFPEDEVKDGVSSAVLKEADVTTADAGIQSNAIKEVEAPRIEIEATITKLTEEQKAKFGDNMEFWNSSTDTFYIEPNPAGVDTATISEALRVTFLGWYDAEEDDFQGKTYFTRSLTESDKPEQFTKKDKQLCGFLYLRSIRTGSRALSLERGSLLDIILRLKEVRPQMWEDTIGMLSGIQVANNPKLGISGVLGSIEASLKKYVPKEWGIAPHLKVSNLTRENLRKVITAFIATGEGTHAAPYYRQGTGTINMLVLAMLSQIAEDKQNVIFAMEEPETAIPPYAQKRIIHEVRKLASQAIFTSHSPYVLEEFTTEETVVLGRDMEGVLRRQAISLPEGLKAKRYRQDFRTRFCEGLLARRVLVAEGATEAAAFPVSCRRLAELESEKYSSLEALGVCTIDAGGETNIPVIAKLYRELGKETFAICDKQADDKKSLIEEQVELLLMHGEKGFENLVLKNTTEAALRRFAKMIDWPKHLITKYPNPEDEALSALRDYFEGAKANWGIADFLAQCNESEIPQWIRDACAQLTTLLAAGAASTDAKGAPAVVPSVTEPVVINS